MTNNKDRNAVKEELKKKYSELFDKLTESEQIRTEAVLNFNVGGKWSTSLTRINFTEDSQTVDAASLMINRITQ